MTRLFTIIVLSLAVHASSAQDDTPSVYDAETARSRLVDALGFADTDPDRAADRLGALASRAPTATLTHLAHYNLGVLELNRGDHAAATAALELACETAPDDSALRDARYNLGHAHHAEIQAATDTDSPPDIEAIDEQIATLGQAERAFLGAARLDPSFDEAVRNLERVRREIRDLEEQKERLEQQQQQQQGQGQQDQDGAEGGQSDQPQSASDELQRLADEQREQAQQNQSSPGASDEERARREQAQEDLSEQTQRAAEALEEQADEDTRGALDEARAAQERAQEALERNDTENAAQEQQRAADALDRAAEQAREQESQQRQQQQAAEGEPGETGRDAEPEIDPLARELLEREQRQREQRREYRPGGRPVRVEEDW